jgi:GNAT superfamily N-acetyltransferase
VITLQQERFAAIIEEMLPLIGDHWAEVTGSGPPLDPAWDIFRDLDAKGLMRALTVRSDGELVGYITFILCPALHYQTIKLAHDDAFYLRPEHRKGTLGIRMFVEAEKMLAADGVNRIMYHEKHKRPMGRILEYLDYTPKETIWFKDLE